MEVITDNTPAIKSYQKFGYTINRKLKCYRGEIIAEAIKQEAEIREVADFGWKKMKTFWDVQPTWQNSVNVLEEIKEHCKILGAFIGGQLVGYLVFNPEAKRYINLQYLLNTDAKVSEHSCLFH